MWTWHNALLLSAGLALGVLLLPPVLWRLQQRCVQALLQPCTVLPSAAAKALSVQLYWPLHGQAEHVVAGLDKARLWRYPRAQWQLLLHSTAADDASLLAADCLQQPGFRHLPVRWLSAAQRTVDGLDDDADLLLINTSATMWHSHWLNDLAGRFQRAPLMAIQLAEQGWALRLSVVRPWLERGVEPRTLPALLAAQGYELQREQTVPAEAGREPRPLLRSVLRASLRGVLLLSSLLRGMRPWLGGLLLLGLLAAAWQQALHGWLWLALPLAALLLRQSAKRWARRWRRLSGAWQQAPLLRVG